MGRSGEVAAGYRLAPVLTHAIRVRRLYRRALKLTESWACDRELWLRDAAALRARFDAAASATPAAAARLLREGEEEALRATHPDMYTVSYMPGGSKFMRNPPLPLGAVFASTPGGIPPEYNIAEQTVTCIQVPQSAQPDGPQGVLVDAYQKRYN